MSAIATTVTGTPLDRRTGTVIAIGCLVALCAVMLPLFLRMPLTNDTEVYDLQAAGYRSGSVLYRDFLEPNLPGVIWLHLLVRSVAGESPEAMRVFDLLLFAVTAALAGRLVVRAGGSPASGAWTMFGMAAFYFTASEWCHCQRDVWMLCPALAATALREASLTLEHPTRRFLRSLLEGLILGCAVWLKPHVVLPAGLVWVVSLRHMPGWRSRIIDTVGMLVGGAVMGGVGIGWMMSVGCWQPFVETLRDWNPAYFRAGREHWTGMRFLAMTLRQSPWCLLHLVAVGSLVYFGCKRPLQTASAASGMQSNSAVTSLLAALYAGWMFQALFLQHLFDYVYAPTILLAILLVASIIARLSPAAIWWPRVGMAFAVAVVWTSPALRIERLQHWGACWQVACPPAVRDALAHFPNPDRQDLAEIARFLREATVTERDVCFYNSDFVSLYRQLHLQPPVRYTYFFETLQFFPDRRLELLAELQQSPHRFVVTDLVSVGMPRRDAEAVGPDGPRSPPPAYRRAPKEVYPWSCPVVYRAGTYLVHRVPEAAGASKLAGAEQHASDHP